METIPPSLCPRCHLPVAPESYFCPNCGLSLKEKEASVTVLMQIGIYALSIFLPPLGLWPGIKYARRSNRTARRVGWIAIALTIISTVVTIWLTFALLNVYLNTLTQSLGGSGISL
jgi:hypothetical protein